MILQHEYANKAKLPILSMIKRPPDRIAVAVSYIK